MYGPFRHFSLQIKTAVSLSRVARLNTKNTWILKWFHICYFKKTWCPLGGEKHFCFCFCWRSPWAIEKKSIPMHPDSFIFGLNFVTEEKSTSFPLFPVLNRSNSLRVVCAVVGAKTCHLEKGVAHGLSACGFLTGISEICHQL